jgi:glucokinase
MTRSVGLDLGGTALKWAVLADGDVRAHGTEATPAAGPAAVVELMARLVAAAGPADRIGVGVPGLYEPDGTTTLLPNVPGDWHGFPLAAELGARTGLPVALANDARAFTLAELRVGAGRGCRDVIAVTLGTGVGGGVTSNGRLHLGHRHRAGELGHQTVDPNGLRCGCGARGCVETVASAPAIVAAAARAVLQGVETQLRDACDGDVRALDVGHVAACARAGDAFARDVLERAGWALGRGLANACTILAPERIIIGGGVAAVLDLLRPTIEETIMRHALLPEPPRVVPAALGPRAGAVGAALWGVEAGETGR